MSDPHPFTNMDHVAPADRGALSDAECERLAAAGVTSLVSAGILVRPQSRDE